LTEMSRKGIVVKTIPDVAPRLHARDRRWRGAPCRNC
jgi:hypothetical protein